MKTKLFAWTLLALLLLLLPSAIPEMQAAEGPVLEYELSDYGDGYTITGWKSGLPYNLVLPDTYNGKPVIEIGYAAFSNCPIKSVVIPDSVIYIQENAFYRCQNLTSVTIGKGVTLMFREAFYNCPNLKEVHITDLAAWCNIDFSGGFSIISPTASPLYNKADLYVNGQLLTELTIPSSVTTINPCAFRGCTSLTKVTIPDHVTQIGKSAFAACVNLTTVSLPSKITSIDAGLFSGCSSLTDINIPDSVTSIGGNAFSGCSSLTDINIPDRVASIGEGAFSGCTALTEITLPQNLTSIGKDAFADCTLDKLIFADGTKTITQATAVGNPVTIVIPDSVTSIGAGAFNSCTRLENIWIRDPSAWCKVEFATASSNPMAKADRLCIVDADGNELTELVIDDSVTEIPDGRFQKCRKPIRLVLGDNVARIGESAFKNCTNLAEIIVPVSLDRVHKGAFDGCSSLRTVYYKGSVSQWNLVIIDSSNVYFEFASIFCDYTDEPKPPAQCDHFYLTNYDHNMHWLECLYCSETQPAEPHIPDGEPTEDVGQYCITCGYMMQDALEHTHILGDVWETNQNGHWRRCTGCGERLNAEYHQNVPAEPGSADQICSICGYLTKHKHVSAQCWGGDDDGHWFVCLYCTDKISYEPHTPNFDVPEGEEISCLICGYVIRPAYTPTTPTTPTTPPTAPTTPPTTPSQPESPSTPQASDPTTNPSETNAPDWLIPVIVLVAGMVLGCAMMLLIQKAKKPK